eukprot:5512429-Karenia_brevis.AAC.1
MELESVGLSLNSSKCKVLTTDSGQYRHGFSRVLYVGGKYFHVLGQHEWHRYLRRSLNFCTPFET